MTFSWVPTWAAFVVDGDVSADAVLSAAKALTATRPGLAKNMPAFDRTQGLGGQHGQREPSFADLFK